MPTLPSLGGLRGRAARPTKNRRPSHAPNPVPRQSFVVDCGVYLDGERLPGEFSYAEALDEARARGGFTWIGLHEPDAEQITGIAETFGLHELAVEDAVHAHQRPKLERYDDMLFMVLKTVRYVENATPENANQIVETGEIMAFIGKDFIVTVRHGAHSALASIRRALEADPEQLALGPAAVLHAIADHIVDTYLAVTSAVEDDIDEMEARVFEPNTVIGADPIYLRKREVLKLRRAVYPLATPLRRLSEGYTPLIPDQVRSYFRNVDDHLTTVSERVAGFDELLTTLIDVTQWTISLRQSTDMRKITSWAAIIAVPTMVAGIYGMNFRVMPELNWTYSYPVTLGVILLACVVLYRILRRNRWL